MSNDMPALTMNDMISVDQFWAEAQEPDSTVPDGQYLVKIDVCRPEYTKENKRKLQWEMTILEGEFAGRKLFKQNLLESEQNIGWLKADLRKVGIDVDSPAFRPSAFLSGGSAVLIEKVVKVSVKNRPADNGSIYANVNFMKQTTGAPGQQIPVMATNGASAQVPMVPSAPTQTPAQPSQPQPQQVVNPWTAPTTPTGGSN